MREKIKAGGHSSPYRLHKQFARAGFGQIKRARGFRQFLMRGFEKVRAEWGIVCAAHNLLEPAQGRSLSAAKLVTHKQAGRQPEAAACPCSAYWTLVCPYYSHRVDGLPG